MACLDAARTLCGGKDPLWFIQERVDCEDLCGGINEEPLRSGSEPRYSTVSGRFYSRSEVERWFAISRVNPFNKAPDDKKWYFSAPEIATLADRFFTAVDNKKSEAHPAADNLSAKWRQEEEAMHYVADHWYTEGQKGLPYKVAVLPSTVLRKLERCGLFNERGVPKDVVRIVQSRLKSNKVDLLGHVSHVHLQEDPSLFERICAQIKKVVEAISRVFTVLIGGAYSHSGM